MLRRFFLKVRHIAHNAIPNGKLGLNVIIRRYAKVSTRDFVSVSRFGDDGGGKIKFICGLY